MGSSSYGFLRFCVLCKSKIQGGRLIHFDNLYFFTLIPMFRTSMALFKIEADGRISPQDNTVTQPIIFFLYT
jgi:hypothetical protein